MEEKVFEGMKYLISYPKEFCEEKKYPLLIFLHGAGSRGEETEKLRKNSCVVNLLQRQAERGYVLVAPLCKRGDWYEWMTVLVNMVKEMREYSYIDQTRVYLTGNSMGGYGTWALASLHADWFAAAMPICGGGIGGFGMRLVDLPIRTFHGICDKTVDPIESLQMAKAVNLRGGHVELYLYPNLTHNCWDAVYTNEKNYDWMFSFTTERDRTPVENLSGDYYG